MAIPALNQLVGFPSTLKLSSKKSETFNSGANVTSPEAATLVMRFELPAGWTFDNGTAKQQTSQPIGAGQTMTIRMDWRAIAATENDLQVWLTVFVSLEGHAGEEKSSAVMSVQIGELAMIAAKSAPVLNRLDGFPPEIQLFAFGGERRSNALTSGASVTSADAGVVVMRFEAPDGYRFDNNTAAQSTNGRSRQVRPRR